VLRRTEERWEAEGLTRDAAAGLMVLAQAVSINYRLDDAPPPAETGATAPAANTPAEKE
jgi:hypothetical protein